jgi:NTE family protein
MTETPSPSGLVLALGGGGAKGLAHIGVLQVLAEEGIKVRAVAGTSVGAEVGAFLAAGMPIPELISLATSFDWKQTLQLFLPDLPNGGGFTSGKYIMAFLNSRLGHGRLIEELAVGYAAVATDLESGEQVVLNRGSLIDAVRASLSMPAVLTPHPLGGRLLVDGSIVNPVPFDVARILFGGPVLAIAVNSGAQSFWPPEALTPPPHQRTLGRQLLDQPWATQAEPLRQWMLKRLYSKQSADNKKAVWGTGRVLDQVTNIMAAQLMHLRMAQHPPDLMLVPDVRDIGPLGFYRSKEAIAAGRATAIKWLPKIRELTRIAAN